MGQIVVSIAASSNGRHDYNTDSGGIIPVPEGYALLPEDIATEETENFPYAQITTVTVRKEDAPPGMDLGNFGYRDEIDIVTSWTPIEPPVPHEYALRVDRLYRQGEIFEGPNGTLYKITLEIPAHGAIAVGTNCEIVTMNELLESI